MESQPKKGTSLKNIQNTSHRVTGQHEISTTGIPTSGNDRATSPDPLTPDSSPNPLFPALCPLPGIMNDNNQSSFPTGTRLFSEVSFPIKYDILCRYNSQLAARYACLEQTVQASMQTGAVENTATRDAAEHVEMREMAETAEDVGNSNAKHVSGDA
ncbi:hypothetical protein K435DRAFT_864896 [Dendrothele bispora CBS 962.96]|uniref:Uncharacterized protein n=1 Tax=Dendrothele bispora (strain CBS 962.96) TaxID=1314807 RepID=A0A4S8LKX1_DENBC|nr:hypothetical protein K435DRAFT_864896 [Dendrothele bispora CBS 962.96]